MKQIKEEIKYPIYVFNARWAEDGQHDEKYPHWHEGLPEGRIWNSTSFNRMYKEEQTQEQLDATINEWWEKVLIERADKNPGLYNLEAKYKEHESWMLTWFQHETIDVGQTNEEALNSFEQYVRRYEYMQDRFYDGEYPENYHCLMGAEDRYRWHGAEPNGTPKDHSPAPCRCKFCKEQSVIRIAH